MANRVVAARVAAVRVVGIGASAGGLDAFIDLISAIPAGTGLAFVLIQHLDPRHDSMLVDILAGATAMPVQEVIDGMHIERDHVYVIPPDTRDDDRGRRPPPRAAHAARFRIARWTRSSRSLANDRKSARDRRRALRQRRGWRGRTAGHSRRGRNHVRPDSGEREVRRHAAAPPRPRPISSCRPPASPQRLMSIAPPRRVRGRGADRRRTSIASFSCCARTIRSTSATSNAPRVERRILRRVLLGESRGLAQLRRFAREGQRRGRNAVPGSADRRDLVLPRAGAFRSAEDGRLSRRSCENASAEHERAHLGGGLLDGRRGLFARHHAAGVSRRACRRAADLDLRNRHQRAVAAEGAGRRSIRNEP